MMNWFWVIPWVVAIIFAAGWYFGSKKTALRVRHQARKEQEEELSRMNLSRNTDEQIDAIHRRIGAVEDHYMQRLNDLDKKIFDLENKEEKNNG